jgi:hypothetical protein
MLAASALIVVLSFLLQVRSDDRVSLVGLPQYPLPHTCPARALFHINCPGCGLTRGFIHLAHARWRDAWQCHRLTMVLAASVLLQFPYRLISLCRPDGRWLGAWFPPLFGYTLIALLIGNWLLDFLISSL